MLKKKSQPVSWNREVESFARTHWNCTALRCHMTWLNYYWTYGKTSLNLLFLRLYRRDTWEMQGGTNRADIAKISQNLSKLKTMAIRAKLRRSLGLVVHAAATEWWQLFTTAIRQTPALLCTVVPTAHEASIEVQNACQQYSTQLAMTLKFVET